MDSKLIKIFAFFYTDDFLFHEDMILPNHHLETLLIFQKLRHFINYLYLIVRYLYL